jgi:disulfide bond formation protein DsbB
MRNALRRRFWFEMGVAIVTSMLFVITLVRNDWIETVFGVDPDNNNGTLEWLIVGVLLAVTIALFILASYEWRRARIAVS